MRRRAGGRLPAILRLIACRPEQVEAEALPEMELIFYDITEARRLDPTVCGVLRVNALAGFDFTLTPATGHLELTGDRPGGEVVPFYSIEAGSDSRRRWEAKP